MIIIEKLQFEDYVKQYKRLVITICLSFTKNYFDAEDLAQQTFIAAYKNYEKFDGNNFKAWITTIAANKCKDYLKSRVRGVVNLSKEEFDGIEDQGDLPEETVLKNSSNEKVYKICSKLKEPYRTVSISYFCKDIKLSHLANQTGKSIKTLETQLYRSKKLLKDLWKEEFM
ncbi:RNA polymerase sigma factor [Haloimpatiens sp. FM7315]|uniref:RNA polymerase sigma factor n=1 Tax=Haloimpatiens sp. FM7315 TaxID=3298609 RepID=UPI0035A2D811